MDLDHNPQIQNRQAIKWSRLIIYIRLQFRLHLCDLIQTKGRQFLGDCLGLFLEGLAKRAFVWDNFRHILCHWLRKLFLSTKSHSSCFAVLC